MGEAQNIYDNPTFFEGYRQLRGNQYSANNVEEKPALFSLSPELTGKSVLDLGCGYGENCAEFKNRGASAVVGVDISEKMLAVAMEEHPDIKFVRADMSDLSFIEDRYDVVFSSLALHYIEDFDALVKGGYDVLNPGGYFIFSQEHPLGTAPVAGPSWATDEHGNVSHYRLTDYSRCGKRSTTWLVDGVEKYHRTFSEIINSLCSTGFTIETMLEPTPPQEMVELNKRWEKNFHKPNFLLLKVRK